jgi:hypothetical protein
VLCIGSAEFGGSAGNYVKKSAVAATYLVIADFCNKIDSKRTFAMSVAAPRNPLNKQDCQAFRTPDAFATWLEIASISAGERQSYGSNPNPFNRARTAGISLGGVPDSMIEETNAANSGGDHPCSFESSV